MAKRPPKLEFEHCAADYASYRPTYPGAAFDLIEDLSKNTDKRVAADVGAGTGIFSLALGRRGWDVLAVEPGEAMLRRLVAQASDADLGSRVQAVCASAEATALADMTVGLVTVAQAFHWFNPPYALAEFARILCPGGTLLLIWNNRNHERSPFVEAFEQLVAKYNPNYQREYRNQDWADKVAKSNRYEPMEYHRIDHVWRLAAEDFVGFTRSVSYIRNILSRGQRPRFEDELRTLLKQSFPGGECTIPLRTDVWTTYKR